MKSMINVLYLHKPTIFIECLDLTKWSTKSIASIVVAPNKITFKYETLSRNPPASVPTAAPISELQQALNPGWEVTDAEKQRLSPDPYHAGEYLTSQLESGEWIERATHFEAVAVTGDGVFDTLKAISKLVLKTLS